MRVVPSSSTALMARPPIEHSAEGWVGRLRAKQNVKKRQNRIERNVLDAIGGVEKAKDRLRKAKAAYEKEFGLPWEDRNVYP